MVVVVVGVAVGVAVGVVVGVAVGVVVAVAVAVAVGVVVGVVVVSSTTEWRKLADKYDSAGEGVRVQLVRALRAASDRVDELEAKSRTLEKTLYERIEKAEARCKKLEASLNKATWSLVLESAMLREAEARVRELEDENQPSPEEMDMARIVGSVKGCLSRHEVDVSKLETWEYADAIDRIVKHAEAAEASLKVAVEALELYAGQEHYNGLCKERCMWLSLGQEARAALAKLKGEP